MKHGFAFGLFLAFAANGEIVRQSWLYEFANLPHAPTLEVQHRSQVGIRSALYGTTILGSAIGLVQVGLIEFRVQGMQRWVLETPDLLGTRQVLFTELGRHYVGRSLYCGNFALGWLYRHPEGQSLVSVRFYSGVLDRVDQPWILGFRVGGFFSVPQGDNFLNIGLETGRTFFVNETTRLRLLGALGWTHLMRPMGNDRAEHMSFLLGPALELWAPPVRFRVSTNWRGNLDREPYILADTGVTLATYPNSFSSIPDLLFFADWVF